MHRFVSSTDQEDFWSVKRVSHAHKQVPPGLQPSNRQEWLKARRSASQNVISVPLPGIPPQRAQSAPILPQPQSMPQPIAQAPVQQMDEAADDEKTREVAWNIPETSASKKRREAPSADEGTAKKPRVEDEAARSGFETTFFNKSSAPSQGSTSFANIPAEKKSGKDQKTTAEAVEQRKPAPKKSDPSPKPTATWNGGKKGKFDASQRAQSTFYKRSNSFTKGGFREDYKPEKKRAQSTILFNNSNQPPKIDPAIYRVPSATTRQQLNQLAVSWRTPVDLATLQASNLELWIKEVRVHKNAFWVNAVTDKIQSINAQVQFEPHFDVLRPAEFRDEDVTALPGVLSKQGEITRAEAVELQHFNGFHGIQPRKCIRLYFKDPDSYDKYAEGLFGKDVTINKAGRKHHFALFNSIVPLHVQFLRALKLKLKTWFKVSSRHFNVNRDEDNRTSTTQAEIFIRDCSNIVPLPDKIEHPKVIVASLDIETVADANRKAKPNPFNAHDLVNMATFLICRYGQNEPIAKIVVGLGTFKPPQDATHTINCSTEKELLDTAYIILNQTDCILGHNISYDINYLAIRGRYRNSSMSRLGCFEGKLLRIPNKPKDNEPVDYRGVDVPGIDIFCTFKYIFKYNKLARYDLKSIVKELLQDGTGDESELEKIDMPYSKLRPKFLTEAGRHEVAVYNLRDAILPWKLACKYNYLLTFYETAAITHCLSHDLMFLGEQIKVWHLICEEVLNSGFAMNKEEIEAMAKEWETLKFEGGKVQDALQGFYHRTATQQADVGTLDFASLYPSIIRFLNLCYSTLIRTAEMMELAKKEGFTIKEVEVAKGRKAMYVHGKKAVLPEICTRLLSERKRLKRIMKEAAKAGDEAKASIYDSKQEATKRTCNSVYGFTGVRKKFDKHTQTWSKPRFISCVVLAISITAQGRSMIMRVKGAIEGLKLNDPDFVKLLSEAGVLDLIEDIGAIKIKVIYGDTDSLFYLLENLRFKEGIKEQDKRRCQITIGIALAKYATSLFADGAVSMEFEKLLRNLILKGKKTYVAMKIEAGVNKDGSANYDPDPKEKKKPFVRGLFMVRREWMKLSTDLGMQIMQAVISDKTMDDIRPLIKSAVDKLLSPELKIEDITITKKLRKHYAKNRDVPIHVRVAEKVAERDPSRAYSAEDRVPFTYVQRQATTPDSQCGEDIDIVAKHMAAKRAGGKVEEKKSAMDTDADDEDEGEVKVTKAEAKYLPDLEKLFTKQLQKPNCDLFSMVFGDSIKQAFKAQYSRVASLSTRNPITKYFSPTAA